MRIKHLTRGIGLGFIGVALPFAAVQAEINTCIAIPSIPHTITVPGVYCLTGDLFTSMASGNAIEIQTNNVTIDFNGHRLGGGMAGPGTQAVGVHSLNLTNVTLRNGTIKGFYRGVYLENTSAVNTGGHLLEDLRVDTNTHIGLAAMGRGNIIRRNQVTDTGGSTLVTDAYGIYSQGAGGWVLNNSVIGTTRSGLGQADGIKAEYAPGSIVQGNHVSNAPVSTNSFGIELASSGNVTVRDNSISSMETGIAFSGGSTGIYMANIVNGATFPYVGGTAAGSTNY